MTWNEADHPRDELGRFTFGGGDESNDSENENDVLNSPFKLKAEVNVFKNESIANVLLKGSTTKVEIEKVKSQYRDVLLKTLDKLATPAVVLYCGIDKLEKMVKENNISGKLKQKIMRSPLAQKFTETMIGGNYDRAKHVLSGLSGADVQGTLDIAHGEENMHKPDYIKDALKLKNYDDPAINRYKGEIKQKVLKEFKDYGYDEKTISNIKGYYFKDNSDPSRRILESKDFKDILKANKQNILSNKEFSISFPKHGPIGLLSDNNLKNSIGKAQVLDYYINKQGLHLKILDTYDFNKDAEDFLNKAGRSQMLKGNLKPYFSVYEIKIPKEKLDEIWN